MPRPQVCRTAPCWEISTPAAIRCSAAAIHDVGAVPSARQPQKYPDRDAAFHLSSAPVDHTVAVGELWTSDVPGGEAATSRRNVAGSQRPIAPQT